MRLALAATPSVALPTLDWLTSCEHSLEFIITRPDKPAGRGKVLQESPVSSWANENSIKVLKPEHSQELAIPLQSIDCVITIGYGVILPPSVLTVPKFGFINLHFSLLPAWRGAAPVQRTIEHGDTSSGITVFALDAGMDTGPIYVQKEIQIGKNENSGELLQRMAVLGPSAIAATLRLLERGIAPTPQSENGVSLARKISKLDARIDWDKSAVRISRQIRAFTPDPGAWTTWRESRVQITQARVSSDKSASLVGEITIEAGNLIVGCADNTALHILEIKPAGKRTMSASDWVNGARATSGERFD